MELSNRLETIASFVTEGYVVADIGTDHGYIPIYLTSNGNCPRAYAMDVNKEPLSRAKTHIEEENAGEVVSCIDVYKRQVDYIGVVQGIPICFDAKECAKDIFPLQNIHEHQVEFMRQYEEQGGISFLLIYFTSRHVCYYMSFQEMMKYWNRAKEGGVKHFKYEEDVYKRQG